MGLDQYYQSLPPDCELLRRSRIDPEYGCNLAFFIYYLNRIPEEMERMGAAEKSFDFLADMLILMADYPGIEKRNLDLGRHWDMLHFLLLAERRGEQTDEPDWAYRAIHGGDALHPAVTSGIGITIKYLPPEEASAIWERLIALDKDEIERLWNQERMGEAGVYKYNQMHESEWTEDLERLTEFYFEAMIAGEGVIVTCN